jgi:hypothetical protein
LRSASCDFIFGCHFGWGGTIIKSLDLLWLINADDLMIC